MKIISTLAVLIGFFAPAIIYAETLFHPSELVYEGAARFPVAQFGESVIAYTDGTFTVTADGRSTFIVGHVKDQAIGEFLLPPLSKASTIEELEMASNIQPFSKVLNRMPTGNQENIDRITGMKMIDNKLVVNAVEFYDAAASNTDTTFIIENPANLSASAVKGFLKLEGDSHAAGWITALPQRLHDDFRGNYLFGFANNLAINSRSSMGPSAFGVDSNTLLTATAGAPVDSFPLVDYSLMDPLAEDLYNESGTNDLWTEESKAYIGLVIPGSDTYAVFGSSGGHESGIGYKITQDSGKVCGGPCPFKASDIYNYFWLYDVKDLQKVAAGQLLAHEVRPYDYGEIEFPFQNQGSIPKLIIGASFDRSNNMLYFLLGDADELQSQYKLAPILLAYSISGTKRPNAPSQLKIE